MLENPVYFCVIGKDGKRSYGKSGNQNNVNETKKTFSNMKLQSFPYADRVVVYDDKDSWNSAKEK